MHLSDKFPRYTEFDPIVPIYCVTPNEGRCFHRFFDTSPVSPSGRYLACLRVPLQTPPYRFPRPGEKAAVVLVDLQTGAESEVAQTAGWDTQMGANINWGGSDDGLFFNDVDEEKWLPVTVRLNPHTGQETRFGRGVYQVSPDGKQGLCCSLEKMRRTQIGYGVTVPMDRIPVHWELPEDDGLFLTDLETGDCRLLVSLKELIENHIPQEEKNAVASHCYYGFHSKWSPSGEHILFTVRAVPHPWALHFDTLSFAPVLYYVFTMRPDGSDIACATDARFWTHKGHHINFHPDGKSLTMNNALYGDTLHFVRCDLDGKNKRTMVEHIRGSGHPTVHRDGTHLLTDTYEDEPVAFGDGTIPLRWIDLRSGTETQLARVRVAQESRIWQLRLDAHPAWDRTGDYLVFNAAPDGPQRVFIADMTSLL